MKDLYIIGAGGFGREVAWLAERINQNKPTWNIKGFVDDDKEKWNQEFDGYQVLGGISYLAKCNNAYVVCAIANVIIRKKIIDELSKYSLNYATLIDPSVIISRHVEIGEGSIICAGSIISTDVEIARHVIIDWNCTVGHDDVLSNFVTLYPSVNVSGCCNIGECVELGTGMQIIQGLRVESNTIIGASSCVVKDIDSPGVYVGIPAKKIR